MSRVPFFLLIVVAGGCAPGGGPSEREISGRQSALANGAPASDPAVVVVSGRDGTLCTGTAIAERVVLSAKHCVQRPTNDDPEDASTFSVGVGETFDGVSSSHLVVEILVPPGAYDPGGSTGIGAGIEGEDIALLILADALPVTPVAVRTTPPTGLMGAAARIVGFGVTPAGMSGEKLSADSTVLEVRDRTLVTGPATCSGDSGGPLFGPDADVIGVSSFNLGGCGLGTSHFTRLDVHADLIAAALAAADACTPTGPEVCDARDNDCNGMVDEGCTAIGASCTEADECAGGSICAETPAGRVCTVSCDPRRPTLGCG
ncbi:MAG: trypsin-like serine protease, partial [Deltaproteobacteria bacterium]|nr:trypsin-like serine protease [Deltaproteobacteria bacterium]